MRNDLENLKTLGRTTETPTTYDPTVLDAVANRHPERDYWVTFTAPEFTTLCPKTGQPDFATLTIRYIPAKKLVESKSLKLYLFGFRNHGDFHEDVVNVIREKALRGVCRCAVVPSVWRLRYGKMGNPPVVLLFKSSLFELRNDMMNGIFDYARQRGRASTGGPTVRAFARRDGKLLDRSRRSGWRFTPKTTGRLQPVLPRQDHGLRAKSL